MPKIDPEKLSPLGRYVRTAMERHYRDGTAQGLANLLGVSNSAAGRWLTGKSVPNNATLELLSKKLDLDMAELLRLGGRVTPVTLVEGGDDAKVRNRVAAHLDWLMGHHSPLPPHQRDELCHQLTELSQAWDDLAAHRGD